MSCLDGVKTAYQVLRDDDLCEVSNTLESLVIVDGHEPGNDGAANSWSY